MKNKKALFPFLAGASAAAILLSGCGAQSGGSASTVTEETTEAVSEAADDAGTAEGTDSSGSTEEGNTLASTEEADDTGFTQGPGSERKGPNGGGPAGGNGQGGGMTTDKSADTELQEMITEVSSKFTQGEYTDEDTGLTVPYDIYLPEDYDSSVTYPMVVFIGDMTTVGTDMEYPLTQGWGGLIWATEEEQDKHEAIVLVPVYPETIIDDNNGQETITDYVDLTSRMIRSVAEEYSADTDRIYGTGQSMGAMTTLYLAANDPDLYAAVLIVDGQWNVSELTGLESQKMIYIAAGGDEKAAQGQEDVKAMLDADGVPYSEISGLDAQADRDELNEEVQTMLDEGNSINFITWEAGTVMEGVSSNISSEHMASFDYGYKLSSVRDWLFAQTK